MAELNGDFYVNESRGRTPAQFSHADWLSEFVLLLVFPHGKFTKSRKGTTHGTQEGSK